MFSTVLVNFVGLFVTVFNFLIIIRVLLSWVIPDTQANLCSRLIYDLTEPILGPVRRLLPGGQMIDLSPIVTFFLLRILQMLVERFVAG